MIYQDLAKDCQTIKNTSPLSIVAANRKRREKQQIWTFITTPFYPLRFVHTHVQAVEKEKSNKEYLAAVLMIIAINKCNVPLPIKNARYQLKEEWDVRYIRVKYI